MSLIKSLFSFVWRSAVLSALLTGGIYYFFGETRIAATLDGKPLNGAVVEIDGVYVGDTPYAARLFGAHRIAVAVIDIDTAEVQVEYEQLSLFVGNNINADFNTPR